MATRAHVNVTSIPTTCRYRLTSFLAFLGRLCLLGEAGVQPGRGLAVVTEVQRGDVALVSVKIIPPKCNIS